METQNIKKEGVKRVINKFVVEKNGYLKENIEGYYHECYVGYNNPGNPDYINHLKNTYTCYESIKLLLESRDEVIRILINDIPEVLKDSKMKSCLCVCVPRAKALDTYTKSQLLFREAVGMAIREIDNIRDGLDAVVRTVNTKTTHLKEMPVEENDGKMPYIGITKDTCVIKKDKIMGQDILLIDDIYTKSVNVDEDCIQALLDIGAKRVVFYSVGYTKRVWESNYYEIFK